MKNILLVSLFSCLLTVGNAQPLRNHIVRPEDDHSSEQGNEIGGNIGDGDDDQACVFLERYNSMECHGSAAGTYAVAAWTEPGSPCLYNSNMKGNSVKDQYCEVDKQIFHQTVFVSSKHCKVSWATKAFSPLHVKYVPGKCTYGFKLQSCSLGPCPAGSAVEEYPPFGEYMDFSEFPPFLDAPLDAE
eukprot:scaffold14558_cov137-Cylindrotheca_fusiformis.AAC.14